MFEEFDVSRGAKILVEENYGIKPGMEVLIVTDTRRINRAELFARAAQAAGAEVMVITMSPRKSDGEPPTQTVISAMMGADISLVTTWSVLGHNVAETELRKAGKLKGGWLTDGRFERIGEYNSTIADLKKIRDTNLKIIDAFKGGDKVRITTRSGSDLTLSVKDRWFMHNHWSEEILKKVGDKNNLPGYDEDYKLPDWLGYAEVAVAPVTGTTNGTYVVDDFMGGVGPIHEPITWKIKDGRCVEIEGGEEAETLEELVKQKDKNATNIAEMAFGTNHAIGQHYRGDSFDKAILGALHMALGSSAGTLHGEVQSDMHEDAVSRRVTVTLDGKTIFEDGKLLI